MSGSRLVGYTEIDQLPPRLMRTAARASAIRSPLPSPVLRPHVAAPLSGENERLFPILEHAPDVRQHQPRPLGLLRRPAGTLKAPDCRQIDPRKVRTFAHLHFRPRQPPNAPLLAASARQRCAHAQRKQPDTMRGLAGTRAQESGKRARAREEGQENTPFVRDVVTNALP
jgi:hypothetical protein